MRLVPSLVLITSTFFLACATGSQLEETAAGVGAGDSVSSSGGSTTSGTSSGSGGAGASGGASATTGSGGAGTTTSGSAGTMSSSSTSSGGSCTTNTDGDGLDDCTEQNDGDPWTDPAIFNGMQVQWANQCGANPTCAQVDTLAEVDACVASSVVEEQMNQYSGWDWSNPPDNICSAGYGFLPNWTQCVGLSASHWQADWRGYINLTQSGNHCFAALGSSSEACASIFFNTETTAATHTSGPGCYDVPAGVYPIRWHYVMDNGSISDMHITYCFGGAITCMPAVPIPATMLRVSP